MHNKKGMLTVAATALAVAFLTTVFYVTPVGKRVYAYILDKHDPGAQYLKFMQIESLIDNNYMGDFNKKQLSENAIGAYVDSIGDDYTTYLNTDSYSSMKKTLDGEYDGIGISISAKDGIIKIVSVKQNSPADAAGILKGDILVGVNGKEFNGESAAEAISEIQSVKNGDKVKITVERDGEKYEMLVEKKNIEMEYISSKMIDSEIGYIRIKTFGNNVEDDFKKNVENLKKSGMKMLIIDLRSNPGGLLDQAVKIADYLMPEGVITTVKEANGSTEEYKSDKNELDMKMCVLINSESASASEILSGALRDSKKAVLVGKNSYGKGIVQSIFDLSDGSALRVTVAKYYTPSGECIHKKGIAPDYDVDLPEGETISDFELDLKNDTQLNKAVEVLKEK